MAFLDQLAPQPLVHLGGGHSQQRVLLHRGADCLHALHEVLRLSAGGSRQTEEQKQWDDGPHATARRAIGGPPLRCQPEAVRWVPAIRSMAVQPLLVGAMQLPRSSPLQLASRRWPQAGALVLAGRGDAASAASCSDSASSPSSSTSASGFSLDASPASGAAGSAGALASRSDRTSNFP